MITNTGADGMTYLDRNIRLFEAEDPTELGDASSSTLFLGIYGLSLSPAERMGLVRAIQEGNALAVFIAGEESESVFDDLLQALSVEATPRQMMTKYCAKSANEAMEIFLQATWPYEERFSEWKSYMVVSYAKPAGSLRAAVERIVFGAT
jgi:hypothetical protein